MTGLSKRMTIIVVSVHLMIWVADVAVADLYTYTDRNGVVTMTNDRNAVPKRYRSTMKVTREEQPPQGEWKEDNSIQQRYSSLQQPVTAVDAAPSQPDSQIGRLFAQYTWLKPIAVFFAILASFSLVVKIAALVSSPQLAKIIYAAFFLGSFALLSHLYAQHVVSSYFAIKDKVIALYSKANNRETGPNVNNSPESAGR